MADDSTSLSPELPDELVHEIVLRLPPDEPACLARLSLLSRPWHLLLSDPSFHRRYREFHGKPPMLGFFHDIRGMRMIASRFVPTIKPCPQLIPDHSLLAGYRVCESRHGRVLLDDCRVPMKLVVWDPVTGLRTLLSDTKHIESRIYISTAVLCALDGCDHTACHDGPFRVVFIGVGPEERTVAVVYSSETGEWGAPTSELQLVEDCYLEMWPSVLVGDGLHVLITHQGSRILKYDVGRHHLSLIDMPPGFERYERGPILMATEDGGLGIAHLHKSMLYLWSRKIGLDGVATWTQHRVIDLNLHIRNPPSK